MSPSLEELWLEHALASYARQRHFFEWLGRHQWQWNGHTGQLWLRREEALDEIIQFSTQVLGSESRMSETWTWIWADETAQVPEHCLQFVSKLRAFGEENNVPEFVTGEFSLAQANGHLLGLTACGVLAAPAYYCGTYLGGAGFIIVDDTSFPVMAKLDAPLVMNMIRDGLRVLVIEKQRTAVQSFLHYLKWQVEKDGPELVARGSRQKIKARFDGNGRLIQINEI